MAGAKDALNGTDYFYQQYDYGTGSDHRTVGLYRDISPIRVLSNSLKSGYFTVDFTSSVPYEDVEAIVYSMKAKGNGSPGYVAAYAPGSVLPDATIVNYLNGVTASNTAITPIRRSDDVVQFYALNSAHITIDVIGYVADMSGDEPLSSHRRVTPLAVPTRPVTGTTLGPGQVTSFIARGGSSGVPTAATHVIANLTVVNPTTSGSAVLYKSGSAPGISHLEWAAGSVRANLAIVPIGTDNYVRLRNATGTATFIVDILGYSDAQAASSSYGRTLPAVGGAARLYDSRSSTPLSATARTRCINVYGFRDETGAGLPIDGLNGLWLNVAAVSPSGPGFLKVFGQGWSTNHSNVNFLGGDLAVSNLVFVRVPPNGNVCAEYGGVHAAHFIFDAIAFTREST